RSRSKGSSNNDTENDFDPRRNGGSGPEEMLACPLLGSFCKTW
ncbi:hypothetical protein A2U01_0081401, partial [Trifolium medium]|nr:hypothetical protein [Trifolium medium]